MKEVNNSLIRPNELIEYLGIHSSTLWRWRRTQGFPKAIKLGSNSIAWRRSTIDEWLEQRAEMN
jgi:prophage regulatory protein